MLSRLRNYLNFDHFQVHSGIILKVLGKVLRASLMRRRSFLTASSQISRCNSAKNRRTSFLIKKICNFKVDPTCILGNFHVET